MQTVATSCFAPLRENSCIEVSLLFRAPAPQRCECALHVGRQRRFELHSFAARWVRNRQPMRVQRLALEQRLVARRVLLARIVPDLSRGINSNFVIAPGRRTAGRTAPGSRRAPGGSEFDACGPSSAAPARARSRRNRSTTSYSVTAAARLRLRGESLSSRDASDDRRSARRSHRDRRSGTPTTIARYSFSTSRDLNCAASASCAWSFLATTITPLVSRSSRCTMPGRVGPPRPLSGPK